MLLSFLRCMENYAIVHRRETFEVSRRRTPSHAVARRDLLRRKENLLSRTRRRPLPVSVSAIPRRPVPKALVRTAPQRPCRTRPPIPSSPQRQNSPIISGNCPAVLNLLYTERGPYRSYSGSLVHTCSR